MISVNGAHAVQPESRSKSPMLGGERFMTDKELCARLQLSRRTLQDYRNNGVIPYIQLGGKILYRESDIQKILMANYREAYRMKGL
ncbi:MAG: helix-turn-helix domain-containing protein [Bacteroides sp.]